MAKNPNEKSITFSNKLMHEFTGKDGKPYVAIKIPEMNWGQIVVPADKVYQDKKHDNLHYTYLDTEKELTLRTSEKQADGTWNNKDEKVSAAKIVEAMAYKKQEAAKEQEAKEQEAEAEEEMEIDFE